MSEYTAILTKKKYTAKTKVYNVVTSCADATATATNSLGTNLGSAVIASGGTGNIPIGDSLIKNTAGLLANLPAEQPYTVGNSLVTLTNTSGTVLSTNNLPATVALPLTAPNSTTNVQDQNGNPLGQVTGISGATNTQQVTIPTCDTLEELVDTSTNQEVYDAVVAANKECPQFRLALNGYGGYPFATVGSLFTGGVIIRGIGVSDGLLYVTASNNVNIYDAATFAPVAVIGGFSTSARLAFTPLYWIVSNFSANTVRVMRKSDNTQLISFAVTTGPAAMCVDPTNTYVYVAPFSTGAGVFKYEIATGTQIGGAIGGFDNNMAALETVGSEWWALTATGTLGPNTQRIRKMDFSDAQVSSHDLGTVTAIGVVRGMCLIDNRAMVLTALANMMRLYEYDTTISSVRNNDMGVDATNSFGLATNPAYCDMVLIGLGTAQLVIKVIV